MPTLRQTLIVGAKAPRMSHSDDTSRMTNNVLTSESAAEVCD